jgi:hypothetical protein
MRAEFTLPLYLFVVSSHAMQRRGLNTGFVLNIKRRGCLLCTFRGLVSNAFPLGDWEEESCPFVPHVQFVFREIISLPPVCLKFNKLSVC